MSGVVLAVVGCRQYDDFESICNKIDRYIAYHDLVIKEIVSGDAPGIDQIAEDYAISRGYAFRPIPADWDTHGKSAGFIRNDEIVSASDNVLAFWDNVTKGTGHSIDLALKKRKVTTTAKIVCTEKRYYSKRWRKIYAERSLKQENAA